MGFKCSDCGEVHDELPRYFHHKAPETSAGKTIEARPESKSMARFKTQRWVWCELELPLAGLEGDPLGFVCWVEVAREDYDRLLRFRGGGAGQAPYTDLVAGKLANPIPGVAGSWGTKVKFAVVEGDPTPYIKWIEPETALAARVAAGATAAFWHELIAQK